MLPIVHEILRWRRNIAFRRRRKQCREAFNLDSVSDNRFKELFRINKALYGELFRLLSPHLHHPMHRDKVPIEQKILVALRFYATGSYQRCIGGDFNLGVSQTSAHRYIHEVTRAINEHISERFIAFPTTQQEMNRNKEIFMERYQFPGVIGAVDGTHVAILKPHIEEHNFINRKGFHSLNVQVICDADLKFLHINANYPGSNHDSFIWRHSQPRHFLIDQLNQNNLRRSWVIGDSGYPLEPFLMTPYLNPLPDTPQARYNKAHIAARNTVERSIGVLKMRFRCLLKERVARYEPNFVGILFNTCATLHNMCLEFGVDIDVNMDPIEDFLDNIPVVQLGNPQHPRLFNEGQRMRNEIVQNYFQ